MARRTKCGGALRLAGGRRRRGGALRLAGGARGKRIVSFLKKAHNFIKKHKILSRGAKAYSMTGLPFGGHVGKAGSVAGKLGYGRRRRTCRRR